MNIADDKDFQLCCDIIERLEEIGDEHILADAVRVLCANSKTARDVLIGQYQEEL